MKKLLRLITFLTLVLALTIGPISFATANDTADDPPPADHLSLDFHIPPPPMPSTPTTEPELPEDGLFYTGRVMGLFEYPGARYPFSLISPQYVRVLEEYGDWLKIGTWIGPRWIYLNFTPPTNGLDNLMRRFPNTSVFFYNTETSFSYSWNGDRQFFGASISKAFYALYLYQRAERGEIDLNSYITFTQADRNAGSGIINRSYPVGTQFTIRRLLELNLYESDNVATNMLRRTFGLDGYRRFIAELGGNSGLVRYNVFNSQLTANEAGLLAQAIWEYIESDGRYSEEFRLALLNNQFPFMVSDYPVASKTGWTSPIAWHDMAFVYADSPYILIIMSARAGWTARDYRDFEEISMYFQEFNDRWF